MLKNRLGKSVNGARGGGDGGGGGGDPGDDRQFLCTIRFLDDSEPLSFTYQVRLDTTAL